MTTTTTTRSNVHVPILSYGILMVGTVALVFALYNLIIVIWRSYFSAKAARSNKVNSFGSSFKYKRDGDGTGVDPECVVCLSVFEEGEELRQLPKCNHSFHAPCIDMWLYSSHMGCPLCRCNVELPGVKTRPVEQPEHYHEGLLVPIALV